MANQRYRLRSLVEARANWQCEYCHRYQELIGATFFEVEHIQPRSLGGLTIPQNLALACRRCNLYKSNIVVVLDSRTGRTSQLFNPRIHKWHQHFRRSRDLLRIYGRSPIGRVTVEQLKLNIPAEQKIRKIQLDYLAELFPLN